MERFEELLAGYLEDTLDDESVRQLAELVEHNELARQRFLAVVGVDGMLRAQLVASAQEQELVRRVSLCLVGREQGVKTSTEVLERIRKNSRALAAIRTRRNRIGWWSLAALILAAVAIGVVYRANADAEPIAVLAAIRGDVYVTGGADQTRASQGRILLAGEGLVSDGDRSEFTVAYSDHTRIQALGACALAGLSDRDGKTLTLAKGSIVAEVAKQPAGRPLVIGTPHGFVTVVGTSLRVAVDGAATRLDVTSGVVKLSRLQDGATIDVNAGQFAMLAPGLELVAKPISSMPERGLISYWPFDESDGDVAADASGHGNQGHVEGTPSWTAGKQGGAFRFDGTNYISTTTTSSGPNLFTWSLCFKTTVAGGKLIGFSEKATGPTTFHDRMLYMDDGGGLHFVVTIPPEVTHGIADGVYVQSPEGISYSDGRWHHVVGILTPSLLALYVDGNQVSAEHRPVCGWKYSAGSWRIGYDSIDPSWIGHPKNEHYIGLIDDVRIYDRELSELEIRSLSQP